MLSYSDQRWCPKCNSAKVRAIRLDQSRIEFGCGTIVDQSVEQGVVCKARVKKQQDDAAKHRRASA